MPKHGTISTKFPGWYIQLQTDVLLQLPRPDELSERVADRLHNNRGLMKKALRAALCPPVTKPAVETIFTELFRETGELSIQLPALKRPTLGETQSKYDWIKSIERDTSTEESVTLSLVTVLAAGSTASIGGREYELRIAEHLDSLLGFQHREWLLEHQAEFPEFMALLGKCYIDFPGIVVVNRVGDRLIPYCNPNGSRWDDFWHWLRDGFNVDGRIAVGK
ncbi:MAG: hypothetical protein ABR884_00540 [Minisyncoccia bacterium]|jgi:hypothetical protein